MCAYQAIDVEHLLERLGGVGEVADGAQERVDEERV